jgi:hypothetical protein
MDRILEHRNKRNFLNMTFLWYTHMFWVIYQLTRLKLYVFHTLQVAPLFTKK